MFERPSLRDPTKTVKYWIVDSVKKINDMKAWKRVIAVFAYGAKWQFQGYPWDTPAQIFDNSKSIHTSYLIPHTSCLAHPHTHTHTHTHHPPIG